MAIGQAILLIPFLNAVLIYFLYIECVLSPRFDWTEVLEEKPTLFALKKNVRKEKIVLCWFAGATVFYTRFTKTKEICISFYLANLVVCITSVCRVYESKHKIHQKNKYLTNVEPFDLRLRRTRISEKHIISWPETNLSEDALTTSSHLVYLYRCLCTRNIYILYIDVLLNK